MKNRIILLRFCYWFGAIADALTAILMLSPKLGGSMYGISNFNPGYEYKYAMGIGASLMLGWTFLLIWADRKPVERRGILLLTVPVIFGAIISGIYAVGVDLISIEKMVPTWIFQGIIALFFTFSYFYTKDVEIDKT